jgi:predicted DNA-binding transcriptional regulator YafY
MPKEARYDRQVRITKLEHLLFQCGESGATPEKLADLCSVSKRTIQRDLNAIETSNVFPMWRQGGHCGIVKKDYLPPIHFSPAEALNLFLAARLMLNYTNRYDPDIDHIFTKLNCILPSPLKEQVQQTIAWMGTLPHNDRVVKTLAKLAEAWIGRHPARITYQSLSAEEPNERIIEPFFIQPAAMGHAAYVIANCRLTKQTRTFKVERIESITVLPEIYTVPADFDANEYLSSAWGIVTSENVQTIKLIIMPDLVRLMQETVWHPSQEVIEQDDGSAIMTLEVAPSWELSSWILHWGEQVEVLGPARLRQEVAEIAEKTAEIYRKKRQTR